MTSGWSEVGSSGGASGLMPDASRGLNRLALILLPGLLLMACAALPSTNPAASHPQVVLTLDKLYYDVAGSSASELRAQLDSHRETERVDAYTDWQIQWRYDYARSADGCRLESLIVSLDVTLTFPRWTPPEGVSPALQERWRAYLAALEAHEQGHEKLAAQAADEIAAALSSLPLYPSCAELEQAADEAGERVLQRYRQLELEYDRETEHGATQGARFP